MGYIYLINELDTKNYKIGVTKSKSIEYRKLKLQTGNSKELFVCRHFETNHPYKLERMLHNHYFQTKLKGEWFEMEDEKAINFLSICEKYQKTIDFLLENNEFYS